jgi:hypothetical protein
MPLPKGSCEGFFMVLAVSMSLIIGLHASVHASFLAGLFIAAAL